MKRFILLILIAAPLLLAAEVFIWHNENPTFHFFDPEDHILVGGEYSIIKALDSLRIDYHLSTILPADLSEYDAVFVLLGSFCET